MAEALLDKTRIRAPSAGTILEVNAKAGEVVAPSPDRPLVVMGDMSVVRVKAEVDEGDVNKIKVNQTAYVTSISSGSEKFEGKVTNIAPTLGSAKIGPRGPLRPTDVEVMEVTIELQGTSGALKPGMRVDAFFRSN
jgi:HlyD family secretion protein